VIGTMFLISAYRVCQKPGSKVGPLTFSAQQWTMARVVGKQNPDPCNDFMTDLIQFVKEQRASCQLGDSILMDANKPLDRKANGLASNNSPKLST
jgi:hypothetical protein